MHLPEEVLLIIFSFVPYHEVAQLRFLSKGFNKVCQAHLNNGLKELMASSTKLQSYFESKLPKRHSERQSVTRGYLRIGTTASLQENTSMKDFIFKVIQLGQPRGSSPVWSRHGAGDLSGNTRTLWPGHQAKSEEGLGRARAWCWQLRSEQSCKTKWLHLWSQETLDYLIASSTRAAMEKFSIRTSSLFIQECELWASEVYKGFLVKATADSKINTPIPLMITNQPQRHCNDVQCTEFNCPGKFFTLNDFHKK